MVNKVQYVVVIRVREGETVVEKEIPVDVQDKANAIAQAQARVGFIYSTSVWDAAEVR